MVVFTPLLGGALTGLANAGLGILGVSTAQNAQRQDYINSLAVQEANQRFARFQADFSLQVRDAQQQAQYWQQTVAYNQQLAYARSMRNYELTKAVRQAEIVGENRAYAGADYVRNSQALADAFAERSMQDAVAQQQYTIAAMKARSSVATDGRQGATIDRLIADYDRQIGDYMTISQINRGFQNRQYSREQAGALAQYISRYNSQQFYEDRPYLEPIAPFQPLPALLEPVAPSFTGAPPGGNALGYANAVLGGVSAGIGQYQNLSLFTNSGRAGAAAAAGGALPGFSLGQTLLPSAFSFLGS